MLKKCLYCNKEKKMRKSVEYCSISCSKKGKPTWNKGVKGSIPWNKGKCLSEEHRKKLSEIHIGKKLTEEHKTRISNSIKGRTLTEEHKKKLSTIFSGRTLSKETKEKISRALKGKPNSWKGRTQSKETKEKISTKNKGNTAWNKGLTKESDVRVLQYSKNCGWSKGLTKETDERIKNMTKTLSFLGNKQQSKKENELYSFLKEVYPKIERQKQIGYYNVDFCLGKKIIEFNGCYWHACSKCYPNLREPSQLEKNQRVKRNINIESIRKEYIMNKKFTILIIWEHEWKNTKEKTKEKILRFLQDGN